MNGSKLAGIFVGQPRPTRAARYGALAVGGGDDGTAGRLAASK